MNFCTYFDINYLHRGLALYYSLERHTKQFTLWILCLDDKTFTILAALNLPNTRLIRRLDFEKDDHALTNAQFNRTIVEYYWTCTPSLPLYIFKTKSAVETLCYLDSDLFFFDDARHIINSLGTGSIFIVPHDYDERIYGQNCPSGRFNVGVMVFRNNATGLKCLTKWREQCIDWCHHESKDGKWGDQGYLEDWPDFYDSLVISRNPGIQAAPWNVGKYTLTVGDHGEVFLNGTPLVCFHFHAMRMIGSRTAVLMEGHTHITPLSRKHIYLPYIQCLSRVIKQLEQTGHQVDTHLNLQIIIFIIKRILRNTFSSNVITVKDNSKVE